MKRDEILRKLKTLMKSSSPVKVDWDAVNEATQITAAGFDSLTVLDLIYDVQQAFRIEFDAEELAGVETVADLVTFLEARINARG